jgi:hypothetical protein
MGIGFGIFLIAVGAILTWAVNASVSGLDLNVVGVVLMIAGAAMVVLSFLFWDTMTRRSRPVATRERVVREDVVDRPY